MGLGRLAKMDSAIEDQAHLLPIASSFRDGSADHGNAWHPQVSGYKKAKGSSLALHASAATESKIPWPQSVQLEDLPHKTPDLPYSEAELQQTDTMINHMILSYISCLALGWGLLFFDWALNEVEKHPKAEPWISNAVTIGGASAVLSPIIQWGHAVAYSSNAGTEVAWMRRQFYMTMWLLYIAIVGLSTLVAAVRYAIGDDGSLHHFISMTSNHLVLARISASLINWCSGKLFIRWYRARLTTGPLF